MFKNFFLGLVLFVSTAVSAEWIMTGATFHSCYLGEAIKANYCAVGGEFVADEYLTEPTPRQPYNKIIELPSGEISVATEVAITREYFKWGREVTKTTEYRDLDVIEIVDLLPGETIWDADTWLVTNQYNRTFEVQKNMSPDGCFLYLRGDWTQKKPWTPSPLTDITLTYTHSDCDK